MIVAGLTGSIGSGKSAASAMLRRMGVPVLCSDEVVHALLSPGGAAVGQVAQRFPEAFDESRGKIDRKALGEIVFRNPEARRDLESLVHPLVHAAQARFLRLVRAAPLAVLDIPLLFETGAERRCDVTICLVAPRFVQERRVLARPGMTRARLEAIRAAQMKDTEKTRRADFVVRTGLGKAQTFRRLRAVVDEILGSRKP